MKTNHVTTIGKQNIRQTTHQLLTQDTSMYGTRTRFSYIENIDIILFCRVTGVWEQLLRHTVNFKIFWKKLLLRCWRLERFSCQTECGSAAPLVRLWCCLFWGIDIDCVDVTSKPAVLSWSILPKVPTDCGGEFYINIQK